MTDERRATRWPLAPFVLIGLIGLFIAAVTAYDRWVAP